MYFVNLNAHFTHSFTQLMYEAYIYILYIYTYTILTFCHYFRGNPFTYIKTVAVLCQQQPHLAKIASVDYIKVDPVRRLYDVSLWKNTRWCSYTMRLPNDSSKDISPSQSDVRLYSTP